MVSLFWEHLQRVLNYRQSLLFVCFLLFSAQVSSHLKKFFFYCIMSFIGLFIAINFIIASLKMKYSFPMVINEIFPLFCVY